MDNKTLIVIGGGAAGFFCAINAAMQNKNLKIIILEKTNKILTKVKVSGGGRCNVTNQQFEINELIKNYPRGANFLKKSFHQFNTKNTIDWFNENGVKLHPEADNRMFPTTNNSQTIIDCFINCVNKYNIKIELNCKVENIFLKSNKFYLKLKEREEIEADFLCIATGGFAKVEQYDFIKKLNNINENLTNDLTDKILISNPIPSLFTFNIPNNNITKLMGVSVANALVKIKNTKFNSQGALLITHWGLSGPSILKLSAFAAEELFKLNYNFTIQINWITQFNETSLQNEWDSIINKTNQNTENHNPFKLPNRLWLYFLELSKIEPNKKWQNVPSVKQNMLIKFLTNMEFNVVGKTTFKEEFVTCGGVELNQINHNTMEHKNIKNLFFAGEILNIDGITGGFNFQSAWTTAWIAAKNIALKN